MITFGNLPPQKMLENLAYLHHSQTYENTEQVSEVSLKPSKSWIALPLALFACLTSSQAAEAVSVMRKGSYGNDVVNLQNQLKQANCFPQNTRSSKYYGVITETAVKKLQQKNNLVVDGVAGRQTFRALRDNKTCNAQSSGRELKLGSQGEPVRLLQVQLNNWGFPVDGPTLNPDGKFGPATQKALKEFETFFGLKPDGIFDSKASAILRKSRLDALVNRLTEDDAENSVRQALAAMGQEAVPPLVKLLEFGDAADRSNAASVLARIGGDAKAAVPELIRRLDLEEVNTRSIFAEALGSIGPDARVAVQKLTELLGSDDEGNRIAAARALGGIGPDAKSAVRQLANLLTTSPNADISDAVIEGLAGIGPEAKEAIPVLKDHLGHQDSETSLGAAFALLYIDPSASALLDALVSDDQQIRLNIATALSFVKPVNERVINKLFELVNNQREDIEVRKRAAISLTLLNQDVQRFYSGDGLERFYKNWSQCPRRIMDVSNPQKELYFDPFYFGSDPSEGDCTVSVDSANYDGGGGGSPRSWFRKWRRWR